MTTTLPRFLRLVLGAVVLGSFALSSPSVLFAAPASESEAPKKTYRVPAGDAVATLKQFTDQSGEQVVYLVNEVRGVATQAVTGDFTPREALNRMLAGTELVLVQDAKTGALTVNRLSAEAKNAASRPADAAAADGAAGARVEDGVVKMGQFEVFGSKLINADLPRTRDDVQPYVVFDRAQLENSGATNLADFFLNRLPMNQSNSVSNFGTALGSTNVNLRGLGNNQTLILVDGRRLPRLANAGSLTNQGDINGIPLNMIERIEVLPSTASGIYGGGATGGVINIITKKDYSGAEVLTSYTNAFDTDAANFRAELNASLALHGGRTFVTLNASRADGTALLRRDRDLSARSRAIQQANNPAAFTTATTPPLGYTPNVRSQTGANLVLKPQFGGAALNSPFTFVPVGYAGPASDNGAALITNAGRYNLDIPAGTNGLAGDAVLLPALEQEAISLGARHRLTSWLEAWADASRLRTEARTNSSQVGGTATLPATAPTNPFTSTVVVAVPYPTLWGEQSRRVKNERLTGGLIARLPANWTAGADYVFARSTTAVRIPALLLNTTLYTPAIAGGTVNVLRDVNTFPLDLTPYLMQNPFSDQQYEFETREFTLRASGALMELPAGSLTLSANAEFRREKMPGSIFTSPNTTAPAFIAYNWSPETSVESTAQYLETRLPVLGERSRFGKFEVQASIRHDEATARARTDNAILVVPSPDGPFPAVGYTDRKFAATKGTAGFRYAPTKDIALRASWGNGFLAPSLSQLAPGTPFGSGTFVTDPKRGNLNAALQNAIVLVGGRVGIEPEESNSVSAGAVFTPRWVPGLRLSLDYTRIKKTNEIATLGFQGLIDNEDLIPGLVTRAPLTPQDQALGYTGGVITQLDNRVQNAASKEVEAYDFQLDYTRRTGVGEFAGFVLATYQSKLANRASPSSRVVETIGYFGALKWRASGGVSWTRGPWLLSWNTQFYDRYFGYTAESSAATAAAYVLNNGTAYIPHQVYHDVAVRYKVAAAQTGWRRILADSDLTVGVQNVFDKAPPVSASTLASGPTASFADPRLRRYTLSVRKRF